MNLADSPLFAAALTKVNRRDIVARVSQAVDVLSQGLKDGEIQNARFLDAKDTITRAFEYAWGEYADKHAAGSPLNIYRRKEAGTAPESDKVTQFIWGFYHPTAHLNAGQIKKIKAFPADPAWGIILPFLEDIAPICDAITTLKTKVVKRQPKSEEEKRVERFTPPPTTTAEAAQVKTLLEEVVTESFEELKETYEKNYLSALRSFVKAQKATMGDVTKNEPKSLNRRDGSIEYAAYYSIGWHLTANKNEILANVVDKRPYHSRHKPMMAGPISTLTKAISVGRVDGKFGDWREIVAADAEDIMIKEAFRDADEVRQLFVTKNLKKLVSVVEGKGEGQMTEAKVVSTHVSLQSLEGELFFGFADGSSFKVKNSVVWSISVLGNQFPRFPLTFHDVKLAGGVKMPMPSEKRMNTIFLGKE